MSGNQEAAERERNDDQAFDRQALLAALGERLRQAREARGESADAVVRELKLRRVYIEALEQGDWEALPDEVYAIGFLKQYAAYLGIDISHEIEQLRGEGVRLTRPLTYPDPPLAPSRRWAWIAGAAFVILFIAFNLGGNSPDQGDERAAAPEPPAMPATKPLQSSPPTTESDARAVSAPKPSPSLAALKKPLPVQEMPLAGADNAPAGAAQISSPQANAPATPSANAAQPAPANAHHFVFEAVGAPVWLQVYPPDPYAETPAPAAHPAREALLQPGQKLRLKPAFPRVWLTTGNAGALRVEIDGETVIAPGGLGKPAQVLHKVPMPPSLDSAQR